MKENIDAWNHSPIHKEDETLFDILLQNMI